MWKNRVLMRRASLQAGLAYQTVRRGEPAAAGGGSSLADLALLQALRRRPRRSSSRRYC